VMVTPLRTLFMAPEVMMTNRVVRRFGEENALRCVFRDDSGARLIVKDFVQGPCCDRPVAQAITKKIGNQWKSEGKTCYGQLAMMEP
uniref:RNA-dependent RNA polymerase n=1 Tax=Haemonchus contortus TaxID=6289 RepID=A0A7I4Z672_HAECO